MFKQCSLIQFSSFWGLLMIMAILLTCGQQKRLIRTLLLTTCYCDTFLIDVMSNFISLTKAEFVEFHVQISFKEWKEAASKVKFLIPTVDQIFLTIFFGELNYCFYSTCQENQAHMLRALQHEIAHLEGKQTPLSYKC